MKVVGKTHVEIFKRFRPSRIVTFGVDHDKVWRHRYFVLLAKFLLQTAGDGGFGIRLEGLGKNFVVIV